MYVIDPIIEFMADKPRPMQQSELAILTAPTGALTLIRISPCFAYLVGDVVYIHTDGKRIPKSVLP